MNMAKSLKHLISSEAMFLALLLRCNSRWKAQGVSVIVSNRIYLDSKILNFVLMNRNEARYRSAKEKNEIT